MRHNLAQAGTTLCEILTMLSRMAGFLELVPVQNIQPLAALLQAMFMAKIII